MFAIPKDIISSGMFPHWPASTTHRLCVKVTLGDSYSVETPRMESFPVVIKVYDTLPLYRQFNEPVREQFLSTDKQVIADITLPVSSVGPRDMFTADVKIVANPAHNKLSKSLKLKLLTFQIKEVLECHEGGLVPRRDLKLFTQSKDFLTVVDRLTTTQGVRWEFKVPFPVENESLGMYRDSNGIDEETEANIRKASIESSGVITSANIAKYGTIDKLDEGIPLTHIQAFTSPGKLFLLRYEIVLKVKLSHSRDIETKLPIIVSPFDRASSEYLIQWIKKECEIAGTRFGKDVVNYIATNLQQANDIYRRYTRPLTMYRNTKNDWITLGYNGDAFGGSINSNMVQYID